MTEELCRVKFEAWCISNCNYELTPSDASKRSYRSPSTRRAWIVWQAAWNTRAEMEKSDD